MSLLIKTKPALIYYSLFIVKVRFLKLVFPPTHLMFLIASSFVLKLHYWVSDSAYTNAWVVLFVLFPHCQFKNNIQQVIIMFIVKNVVSEEYPRQYYFPESFKSIPRWFANVLWITVQYFQYIWYSLYKTISKTMQFDLN